MRNHYQNAIYKKDFSQQRVFLTEKIIYKIYLLHQQVFIIYSAGLVLKYFDVLIVFD